MSVRLEIRAFVREISRSQDHDSIFGRRAMFAADWKLLRFRSTGFSVCSGRIS
jgi:hypothetical protein